VCVLPPVSRRWHTTTTYIYIIKQDELLSRGSFVGCMLVKTLLDDVRSQTPSERSTYVVPPADACTYFVPGGGFMVDVTFPFVLVVRSTAPSERIKSIVGRSKHQKKKHTQDEYTKQEDINVTHTTHHLHEASLPAVTAKYVNPLGATTLMIFLPAPVVRSMVPSARTK
jgi:hypothetical protein